MKLSINTLIVTGIILLVVVNIAIFIKGIGIGNEIGYYEKELSQMQEQNIEYEQKIYQLESHTWTASLAAELEYGRYNDPIYSKLPQYALRLRSGQALKE